MNTRDIESILTSEERGMLPYFGGVFARDEFIRTFTDETSKFFVFNTHPSGGAGEHWLGVLVDEEEVHFFDSYGQTPSIAYPDVYKVITRGGKNLTWNKIRLQGLVSTVCGDYCVLFGLLWSRGWKRKTFYNRLTLIANSESRDHLVREIIIELFADRIKSDFSRSTFEKGIQGVHIPGFNLDQDIF